MFYSLCWIIEYHKLRANECVFNMSLSQVDKHKSNCLRLEVPTLPFFHFKTHFQLRKKKNLNKFKFTTMHSFFSYLVSMIKIRFWEAQKQQFMARINLGFNQIN